MFSEYTSRKGRIEVICGSMFSGKTEELIRRLKRVRFANQKLQIFKPGIDTRYAEFDVVSHDSNSLPCYQIDDPAKMLDLVEDDTEVIGIDEAQFFNKDIVPIVKDLANRGIRVIIAGLDMDFKGKPFGPMPNLLTTAEDVTKVHAICVKCGNLASYSHRLSKSKKLVELGEKDKYEPLCRTCYNKAIQEESENNSKE